MMKNARARKRIFYFGDADIEHGGFFYTLEGFEDGYVTASRVQPCSEAGGPNNVFWIEHLSVNINCPDTTLPFAGTGDDVATRQAHRALHDQPTMRIEHALICCGWDDRLDEWDKLTAAQRRHVMIEACVSYGNYDRESGEMVSLGKPEFTRNREGNWVPDTVLRANASLRNYAKGEL